MHTVYLFLFISVWCITTSYSQQQDSDSSDVLDSTFTLDDIDTSFDEPPKPWSIQLRSNILSSQVQNGVELSGNLPTMDAGFKIGHISGFDASIKGTRRLGKEGFYQQTTFNFGYSSEVKEWLTLSANYSYYKYPSDTINPLAGTTSSFTIDADFDASWLYIDVSFDKYFGTDAANYLSFNFSKYFTIGEDGDISIAPSLDVSFTSYEFAVSRLVAKKLGITTKTKKVRGLSSVSFDAMISYNLGKGFYFSLDPMLLVAYQQDVNSKTKQVQSVLMAGFRYKFKW